MINLQEEARIAREGYTSEKIALYVEPLDYEAPKLDYEEACKEMAKFLQWFFFIM